ncbi:MAG: PrgI family protein [Candidatus Pacebacteria bacterium]|nr:PrgI family protein [Candidatus Paceibacterota bacterium]
MQFKVPQFIEIEDKIFGPFTFKQFVYLVGGAALCYILYRVLPGFIAFFFILPVASFAGALTFYKPNGKPFIHRVQAFLTFHTNSKLYLWKKEARKKEAVVEENKDQEYIPRLSDSKLKELSWGLDVLDLTKK